MLDAALAKALDWRVFWPLVWRNWWGGGWSEGGWRGGRLDVARSGEGRYFNVMRLERHFMFD
jgi:hypothetical protein